MHATAASTVAGGIGSRAPQPAVDRRALRVGRARVLAAAIGVVLTGSNADGAEGLRALRRRGAFAIVQDPADAERGEMPAVALAAAGADAVVELDGVAPLLQELAR